MNWLMLKNLLFSRLVIVGLAIVLLAGIAGIYNGRQHLARQRTAIEATAHFQQEHIQKNTRLFNNDMGLLLYYMRFAFVNQSSAINGLSIGQRDVNSSIQFINIRNLEAQKYDTDLYNPVNLLVGNLDFSFVVIFLFPLLIIGLCYNILSEEKEGGTWTLVVAQSARPVKLLYKKMQVRAVVVYLLLAALFAVALPVLSIKADGTLAMVMGLCVLYLGFWLAVCFWMVSLHRRSAVNAVSLLSVWIMLTFILPAAINNYILAAYPVPEALETTVAQREGYHAKWDMAKAPTMERFYAHYPQFGQYTLPGEQFSWLWYYAMQQLGDDDSKKQADDLKNKLQMRNAASNRIATFLPTLHTQLRMNQLARADLADHLQFLEKTAQFHEQLRLHFYPAIFSNKKADEENWSRFRPVYFSGSQPSLGVATLLPLLLLTAAFSALAVVNLRRRVEEW